MLIGHNQQKDFLKRVVAAKNHSHAFLFEGEEKLGKKKAILDWAASFFGREAHPDLIMVEPRKKEIQISQIKDLVERFSLKPFSAPFKAAVIDDAHLMNQESQSALLKTLEEPKGNAFLFLITSFPQILLPTVVSRTQCLKFYPVEKKEIKTYLKGQKVSEKEAEEILEISMGRPGVAVDFASDRSKLEKFQNEMKETEKIADSPLFVRFQYAKEISESPEETSESLKNWAYYFRKKMIRSLNDRGNSIEEAGKNGRILQHIEKTNFLISTTNVNPKMALENLMVQI